VSSRAATVAAQAKVNLFLHVLAREESGYHQIETLFCRLALADDVVVRIPDTGGGSGRTIDCTGDDVGPPEDNLAYRAAVLYADQRGWPSGFGIEVTKRIPVGGGLGGGSADAGAVLRALRVLDPDPPSAATLLLWAARLGADVPVMTMESPLALGWGRGEQLLPLPALPSRAVMLYVPEFRVATREAYQWLDEARSAGGGDRPTPRRVDGPGSLSTRARDPATLGDWGHVAPLMTNDFEAVVGQRHPEIPIMTARLRALPGAAAALMSGSGSTVYCVMSALRPRRDLIEPPIAGTVVMTTTADHVVGVRRID
jgi:4-diphosphocytidyl-2-C-methyl-D-erythritol kinase